MADPTDPPHLGATILGGVDPPNKLCALVGEDAHGRLLLSLADAALRFGVVEQHRAMGLALEAVRLVNGALDGAEVATGPVQPDPHRGGG